MGTKQEDRSWDRPMDQQEREPKWIDDPADEEYQTDF
jgi:hypothetical protein